MRVDDGLDALQKAEMIPSVIAEVEMVKGSIRDEKPPDGYDEVANGPFVPSWVSGRVEIVRIEKLEDPCDDPEALIGRRVDYWLKSGFTGTLNLRKLIEAKAFQEPGAGWEDGIPADENGVRDTKNLEGVRFLASIYSKPSKKGGYVQIVNPIRR